MNKVSTALSEWSGTLARKPEIVRRDLLILWCRAMSDIVASLPKTHIKTVDVFARLRHAFPRGNPNIPIYDSLHAALSATTSTGIQDTHTNIVELCYYHLNLSLTAQQAQNLLDLIHSPNKIGPKPTTVKVPTRLSRIAYWWHHVQVPTENRLST